MVEYMEFEREADRLFRGLWQRTKAGALRFWARLQREVEQHIGLIGALFLLNWFTIFWLNLHRYQTQQLGVLAVDFFFVLGGTALYVALLGLLPVKALGRGLLALSFFLSALLGGWNALLFGTIRLR